MKLEITLTRSEVLDAIQTYIKDKLDLDMDRIYEDPPLPPATKFADERENEESRKIPEPEPLASTPDVLSQGNADFSGTVHQSFRKD
jgi:hypothetical protein